MAENLPRYAVTDLIARVSGMSRGRLAMSDQAKLERKA